MTFHNLDPIEEPSPKGQWDSLTVKDRSLLPGSPNSVLKDRDCGLASVQDHIWKCQVNQQIRPETSPFTNLKKL